MNKASEDYIKNIYILKQEKARLHSIDIAKEFGLSRASVSRAMSNLRKDNIIIMKEDGEELVSISDENDFEKALWLYRTELKKVREEE